jgi:hypothetical protein
MRVISTVTAYDDAFHDMGLTVKRYMTDYMKYTGFHCSL